MIAFRRATEEDVPLLSETRRKAWDATYRGIYDDETTFSAFGRRRSI